MSVAYTLFDATMPDWAEQITALRLHLGAPNNPSLFPLQYLQVTLPSIGGKVLTVSSGDLLQAAAFLFPRDLQEQAYCYTMRYHALDQYAPSPEQLAIQASELLGAQIYAYEPSAPASYGGSHSQVANYDIGRPDADEAEKIPALQAEIWNAPAGALYPSDFHRPDFRPGSTLIARRDGDIAGMLFGFYRFGQSEKRVWWGDHRADLRIESQILGIHPRFRRDGLGFLLKAEQRKAALADGIDIIHWTVDPLQLPNALLNMTKLGAIAFDFYPNYYPFRNALNQVAASRFRLTWLLRAPRVERRLEAAGKRRARALADFPDALILSEGVLASPNSGAPFIAIEIPSDWTALQHSDLERALAWRTWSDGLFSQFIGLEAGKYVIMDVANDGDRWFIIGHRYEEQSLLFEGNRTYA
jgi:predicted GNAT superfamily acetyltransferase